MLARGLSALLLVVHAALVLLALLALAEWWTGTPLLLPLNNPLFPRSVLLVEWLSILLAGAVYLTGFALRWHGLPWAMAAIYAAMAAQCALHTFGYLRSDGRFLAMAVEYAEYALILLFLFRSGHMRRRLLS